MVVWRTLGTDFGENVYVGTKCRPDFGDIRFTSSSEYLDYWLETYDSQRAIFWVKVSDSLEYQARTIYLYYGSTEATTTSNGTKTFLVFRDLTHEFYEAMGFQLGTYTNEHDPGDYFIDSSLAGSKRISPCVWFRSYGWKQYAITSTYLFFEGRLDGGNNGCVGIDLRVRNAAAPTGWQSSMGYSPNDFLYGKHIIATDYSGAGEIFYYSNFTADTNDIPEGNLADSYLLNSSSRTTYESVYGGSIAHITSFAYTNEQFTIYHQYYAVAKYVSLEPTNGVWGAEETLSIPLEGLALGSHSIIVYANDTLGNMGSSGTIEFTVADNPPLSVAILPDSVVMDVGQFQLFTSSVANGTPPYTYQWYLDDTPVSGATSPTWTFTPTTNGTYHVYLGVTDSVSGTAQSNATPVTVVSGVHDISLTGITNSKSGCLPFPTIGQNDTCQINVTVSNLGDYSESFNVTVYVNSTEIQRIAVINLAPLTARVLTVNWSTIGFAKGNYTISALAEPVIGETNTTNNSVIGETVVVVMQGDINGDGIVDIFDIVRVALSFGMTYPNPSWDPNADINNDGIIDIFDLVVVALHFGETG